MNRQEILSHYIKVAEEDIRIRIAINTAEGRFALAEAMSAPIRNRFFADHPPQTLRLGVIET